MICVPESLSPGPANRPWGCSKYTPNDAPTYRPQQPPPRLATRVDRRAVPLVAMGPLARPPGFVTAAPNMGLPLMRRTGFCAMPTPGVTLCDFCPYFALSYPRLYVGRLTLLTPLPPERQVPQIGASPFLSVA